MTRFVVSVTIIGDLEAEDEESAEERAEEIANGLKVLASDLGLRLVGREYEVEYLD